MSELKDNLIKESCENVLKKDDSQNNTLLFGSSIIYTFSYICAVELYELYKIDQEKALNILINIVTNNTNYIEDELEIINSQITPLKRMNKHIENIKTR